MARSREELTEGEWAVLALLAEQPAHGFAVARAMEPEGDVGRVWSIRRPLVYRAIDVLTTMGLVQPIATVASQSGPQRTLLEVTSTGRDALEGWLDAPVRHVRDGRSLLLLKLLFINRASTDPLPLLDAQRDRFAHLVSQLQRAYSASEGFDRVLALWRLENAESALRFVELLLRNGV
jgi:DNA-binding PadR family transcriptional regulator